MHGKQWKINKVVMLFSLIFDAFEYFRIVISCNVVVSSPPNSCLNGYWSVSRSLLKLPKGCKLVVHAVLKTRKFVKFSFSLVAFPHKKVCKMWQVVCLSLMLIVGIEGTEDTANAHMPATLWSL